METIPHLDEVSLGGSVVSSGVFAGSLGSGEGGGGEPVPDTGHADLVTQSRDSKPVGGSYEVRVGTVLFTNQQEMNDDGRTHLAGRLVALHLHDGPLRYAVVLPAS